MPTQERNVVQVEFFHVGSPGIETLEELQEELHDRAVDAVTDSLSGIGRISNGIKTVVRFYDADGDFTAMAQRYQELQEPAQRARRHLSRTSFLRQLLVKISGVDRNVTRKTLAFREAMTVRAAQRLQEILTDSQQVAVELPDYSFRWIRNDEAHELLEAARRATGAWFFIFVPNDLLAENNKVISSITV